jgi:mycothiol synthase
MSEPIPPGYAVRAPTTADAGAVVEIINACKAADGDEAVASVEEVVDDWAGVDLATEAVAVVAPDGRFAGYADLDNRRNVSVSVYGFVHPDHRGRGIGRWLVEWGEARARAVMPAAPAGARVVVQHYVDAANDGARRLLVGAGYEPVRQAWMMAIDLDEAPPRPAWPNGVTVRTFVPGQDERACYEAVEDAFRDIWGRPPNTFERFLGFTRAETFDPSLWFLAEAGGRIVGVALGKVIAGEGQIDVVGVRREWRRRGLGLALMHQAFGAYHARGVRRVELSVDAESGTGAPRLYGRAGMWVRRSYVLFRKELRPGTDLGDEPEA